MEYVFTLKYRLARHDRDAGALVERLAESGCDDALVGTGLPGRVALEFTREARTARAAVRSAIADVKRALPGARLFEAAPDFVGLTDVADLIGVTRQNMRKLMLANMESFPAPVHEGSALTWHLADVLAWLNARGGYAVDPALVEIAGRTREVNLANEIGRLPRVATRGLRRASAAG